MAATRRDGTPACLQPSPRRPFAALNQFVDRPNTRYMGLTHEEMVGFWGMTNYPEERITLDLGGRNILIWGSPGHVVSECAYYNTYTQTLFTGDMFYRGRCYISFWDLWFASMERLMDFLETHPVTHVVGCHVEISRTGEDYPYGITYQPDEAPWHLTVAELKHATKSPKPSPNQESTSPDLYSSAIRLAPPQPSIEIHTNTINKASVHAWIRHYAGSKIGFFDNVNCNVDT